MRNFDIVSIDPIVDWFNIMTYDLHGTWDAEDPFIGSIVLAHTNLTVVISLPTITLHMSLFSSDIKFFL